MHHPRRKDIAALVGHAGDGNFYVGFMLNPNEPQETAEAERLNQRLVYRAINTANDPDNIMNPGKILQV